MPQERECLHEILSGDKCFVEDVVSLLCQGEVLVFLAFDLDAVDDPHDGCAERTHPLYVSMGRRMLQRCT